MLYDWTSTAALGVVRDIQPKEPLTLTGEGLWVCLISSGRCTASLTDASPSPAGSALILPPQSAAAGHLVLSRAPLTLTPEGESHLLCIQLTGQAAVQFLAGLTELPFLARGETCPAAAELLGRLAAEADTPRSRAASQLAFALLCELADADSAAPADSTADTAATEETGGDLLSQIQANGTITVAMEGTWAPRTYHDESDNLVGYDVEVATKIAEKLGVEPKFVEGEWDGLLAGLDAGRYDIMVNGVDITPERAEKYDFSTPYAYNRTAVITQKDNDSIKTLEDLNGKTTANTISSTYAELAEQYGATVTGVDDLNQTFELLLSGRIDATLNAEVTYYDYMKEHPDANAKIAVLTADANEVAIPMRKGDETATLRAAIDTAIEEMRADGTLKELSEKYFGTDISTNE